MRTVGFWLFALLWLLSLAIVARTLLAPGIIAYHAEVMGGTAESLPPGVVTFYFAMRMGNGVALLALAIVNAYLLFGRIRYGDERAALVYVIASTVTTVGGSLAAFHLPPSQLGAPWILLLTTFSILMLAYFLWLPPRAKKPPA